MNYEILKGDARFIVPHIEDNKGAYYYMYSPYGYKYIQAHGTVNLKKIQIYTGGKRNAYISFGVGFPVGSQDIINGFFAFKDSNGNLVHPPINLTANVNGTGMFDLVEGKPLCRLYRFVSFIPKTSIYDNNNDGTYLSEVAFSALQLYDSVEKAYVNWDMRSGDGVEHAYKVLPDKMRLGTYPYPNMGILDSVSIRYD